MKSIEIRKRFLNFFSQRGHNIVPSDSLIPSGDPSLLFTSAGMVQFKKHFLGQSSDKFTRAASCQKCFRTSDIENVGKTNRHLTFFEMLGNFSFGDYFKKEAIEWAWEFLINDMKLPKNDLYITIYKDDDEAFSIWKKFISESRIVRMGEETNFWNMGPTGPCGPCSEIVIDLGESLSCKKKGCFVGCDCDRYLEVWNLVFTQYDRQLDGSLIPLPKKNIDTGMGLERLASIVQNKKSIYETDLFAPIISNIANIINIEPEKDKSAIQMIADHARAITFLVSDGVLPSNEGRGYVLRRVLRRALRKGKLLGSQEAFLYKVVAEVCDIMKATYPELEQRRENISSIIKMEEEKFLETLESGTELLMKIIQKYSISEEPFESNVNKKVIPGDEVFKLYDTYGFPLDLTKEIALENGLYIDEEGFEKAQKEAQQRSRSAWVGSGEKDKTFFAQLQRELGNTAFIGYENLEVSADIICIIKDGKKIQKLTKDEEGEVILSQTTFYPESGGQVGDTGTFRIKHENSNSFTDIAEVINTYKPYQDLIIHKVKVIRDTLFVGQKIIASVDKKKRKNTARHHTSTHLLHKALRQVLGNHVTQAGSLVAPDYFRFDFTHFAALKPEEIVTIENIVNETIRENMVVCFLHMSLEDARRAGAMALFGEKYSNEVRAVSISKSQEEPPFSMELCGGTHVTRTGDIGFFKIISESSISAGVRRIEAVSGEAAERYVRKLESTLKDIALKIKSSTEEVSDKIDHILEREKQLEKEIEKLKIQMTSENLSDIIQNSQIINGVKVIFKELSGVDIKTLRTLSDTIKNKIVSGIIILFNVNNEKISFVINISNDIVKKGYNASVIANKLASLIGGSGGGKQEFAQGGGKDINNMKNVIKQIEKILQ